MEIVDWFSHFCTAHGRKVPIFYNGRPFLPKLPFQWGGNWTPSNTCFHGPTIILNPNGISIGAAVFVGLTSVTDRQTATDRPTDHAARSVTIGRIYVRSTAMRANDDNSKT